MQSRKDKINSNDITERFLFNLFETSNSRKSKIVLFLVASDWCSPTIVSNVSFIQFLRISSINFIVQVEIGL